MRLILDQNDIRRIISEHFDIADGAATLEVKTNPFEVIIGGIPVPTSETKERREANIVAPTPAVAEKNEEPEVGDEEASQRAEALREEGFDVSAEPPPPGTDDIEGGPTQSGAGSLQALIARSHDLAAQIERENPNLSRPRLSGGIHGSSKPPGNFRDET